ncbi:MAG: DNA primase, partial [Oricola sp.]|nr:DNA primase [Oricola sp.]
MSRARDLSQRLAMRAPQAARHYLSNGRPCGAYWIAGDVRNTQGGSLWVRLAAPGAGRWRDEA